jgi:membrane-bound metal-dependent hydrolase YbcI (DUF457 family)
VSLLAFVVSQIVIDCETAYFMLIKQEWPLHRWAHTFVVGTPLGLAAGLVTCLAATLWLKHGGSSRGAQFMRDATLVPSAVGGLLGGMSHAFLDGIMHSDARPFRPFDEGNPLLGALSLPVLHLVLVAAGGAGFALIALAADRRD